jgi:hypothetical protein
LTVLQPALEFGYDQTSFPGISGNGIGSLNLLGPVCYRASSSP